MAASRMKILRLFISNDLSKKILWQIDSSDSEFSTGEAKLNELSDLDFDNLEVYLTAECCSIFTLNLGDISDKRLTEELLLGMLEEKVVDDIEDLKPILLRLADGVAHVAIFNRDYYTKLSEELQGLNKPIKFIQAFAYCLEYQEDTWTVYLLNGQSFIRTSLYEYYSADDQKPIPQLLEDMLGTIDKPSKILLYTDNKELVSLMKSKYNIECTVEDKYNYVVSVWNFYNPKSKKFKLKLEQDVTDKLLTTLRVFKYFASVLFLFWLVNIVVMYGKQVSLSYNINTQLKGIVPVIGTNNSTILAAISKLNDIKHEKGLYNDQDMVALFSIFLKVISNSNGMISGVTYADGKLDVLLNSQFDSSVFASNKAIFATKGIHASISDYKTYKDANSNKSKDNNSTSMSNDDVAWVVSLQSGTSS